MTTRQAALVALCAALALAALIVAAVAIRGRDGTSEACQRQAAADRLAESLRAAGDEQQRLADEMAELARRQGVTVSTVRLDCD